MGEVEDKRDEEKKLLRKALNRLAIRLFILFLLAVIGGFLFRWLEGVKEVEQKCGVKKVRRDFLDNLWQGSRFMKEEEWKSLARRRLLKFEDELHTAFEAGMNSYSGQKAWSYLNSIFYSLTVMTTIGYGHISPLTALGKIFTILYAMIGIPIFTIIMVEAGKVLTRALKLFLTRQKENHDRLTIDEEFNFPIQSSLIILACYSAVGTIFFYFIEPAWGLLGSFYFIFISTSTIGFGDLVPESPIIAIMTSLYFLFGLALTSLVIGGIQERLEGSLDKLTDKMMSAISFSKQPIDPSENELKKDNDEQEKEKSKDD